jgi:hypothetical protein
MGFNSAFKGLKQVVKVFATALHRDNVISYYDQKKAGAKMKDRTL